MARGRHKQSTELDTVAQNVPRNDQNRMRDGDNGCREGRGLMGAENEHSANRDHPNIPIVYRPIRREACLISIRLTNG